jgi:hypothetical protein
MAPASAFILRAPKGSREANEIGSIVLSKQQSFRIIPGIATGTLLPVDWSMNGVDLRTVGELLGHRTFQMTMRYAHLAADHKHEAVSRLDKGIGTGRSSKRGPQRAA